MRRKEWLLAVLFVDLDNFKAVNDMLGFSLQAPAPERDGELCVLPHIPPQ